MKTVILISLCQILIETNICYGTVIRGFKNKSSCKRFRYSDLEKITNKFKLPLGGGGFGKVYQGTLKDGTAVAVKLRSQNSTQGTKQFQSEVYTKFIFRMGYN